MFYKKFYKIFLFVTIKNNFIVRKRLQNGYKTVVKCVFITFLCINNVINVCKIGIKRV